MLGLTGTSGAVQPEVRVCDCAASLWVSRPSRQLSRFVSSFDLPGIDGNAHGANADGAGQLDEDGHDAVRRPRRVQRHGGLDPGAAGTPDPDERHACPRQHRDCRHERALYALHRQQYSALERFGLRQYGMRRADECAG